MGRILLAVWCAAVMVAWLALGIEAHGTRQASPSKEEGTVVRGHLGNWSSTPGGLNETAPFTPPAAP